MVLFKSISILAMLSLAFGTATSSELAFWESSIDGLKCSIDILSIPLSKFYDNRIMCCSLWLFKAYLKSEAPKECGATANRSIEIFDELLNERLLYTDFARSILKDEDANCEDYLENSLGCIYFYVGIVTILIVAIVTPIIMSIGCITFMVLYGQNRRAIRKLYKKAILGEQNIKLITNNNKQDDQDDQYPTTSQSCVILEEVVAFQMKK